MLFPSLFFISTSNVIQQGPQHAHSNDGEDLRRGEKVGNYDGDKTDIHDCHASPCTIATARPARPSLYPCSHLAPLIRHGFCLWYLLEDIFPELVEVDIVQLFGEEPAAPCPTVYPVHDLLDNK